jgi:hypothetical protein
MRFSVERRWKMKKNRLLLDAFVISGFVACFFSGFLNPLYISLILSRLDSRVITLGSFVGSACPVLMGALLGNRRVFERLYAALPMIMLVEFMATLGSAAIAIIDLRAYYLVSIFVFGTFSTSVVYLLQKIKEVRYRRNRASFDRTCDMADACGLLAGSGLSVAVSPLLRDPFTVAALGVLQTAVVYSLFLLLYRRVPARKGRRADEEPHPCGFTRTQEALPAAA